jgi:hypothetical protein
MHVVAEVHIDGLHALLARSKRNGTITAKIVAVFHLCACILALSRAK